VQPERERGLCDVDDHRPDRVVRTPCRTRCGRPRPHTAIIPRGRRDVERGGASAPSGRSEPPGEPGPRPGVRRAVAGRAVRRLRTLSAGGISGSRPRCPSSANSPPGWTVTPCRARGGGWLGARRAGAHRPAAGPRRRARWARRPLTRGTSLGEPTPPGKPRTRTDPSPELWASGYGSGAGFEVGPVWDRPASSGLSYPSPGYRASARAATPMEDRAVTTAPEVRWWMMAHRQTSLPWMD
jgi:hypothetical protein